MSTKLEMVEKIVEHIFTGCDDQKAVRLVLEYPGAKQDGSGWGKAAMVNSIMFLLDDVEVVEPQPAAQPPAEAGAVLKGRVMVQGVCAGTIEQYSEKFGLYQVRYDEPQKKPHVAPVRFGLFVAGDLSPLEPRP